MGRGRGRGQPTQEGSTGMQRGGVRMRGGLLDCKGGGLRTRGGPTGLQKGGPITRSGGRGQVQGTVHTMRLYEPSKSTSSQGNVSVSKLFIILFHCSAFKLMCILLLDGS